MDRLPVLERRDERPDALIAIEHHDVVDQYWRGAHAIDVVEWTERPAPELLAVHVVGKQAVIGEEEIDAFAVGRRRR